MLDSEELEKHVYAVARITRLFTLIDWTKYMARAALSDFIMNFVVH